MYRLKTTSAAFEVVDGPCAGRKYLHGKTYAEVPPQERDKFEAVDIPAERTEAAKEKIAAAEPAEKAEGGKKK